MDITDRSTAIKTDVTPSSLKAGGSVKSHQHPKHPCRVKTPHPTKILSQDPHTPIQTKKPLRIAPMAASKLTPTTINFKKYNRRYHGIIYNLVSRK